MNLRIERAYQVVAHCCRLLVRRLDEPALLEAVCRLAVEGAGYRLAWVGYVEHDEARTVRPVAQFGFEEGYLGSLRVSWADDAWGRGPTGRAVRSKAAQVVQDTSRDPDYATWREQALRRGYRASVALPLMDGDAVMGTLNLYASEPDAFDARELALLQVVADDLAHGLQAACGRARLSSLEEAMARTQRLEAVGRVTAGIVHDINNVLQLGMGASVNVREALPAGFRATGDLDAVDRAFGHMADLSRSLLSFARGAPSEAEVVVLDEVVRGAWTLLGRGFGRAHQVTVELASAPWTVHLDRHALEQVFTNLVLNARDAMVGGGRLLVRTSCRVLEHPLPGPFASLPPGEYVSLLVADDGPGMDEATAARAFEPFFTTKGQAGTGLGLATVFGVVHQARGAIDLVTAPGHGATFEVVLPRASAAEVR